MSLLIFLLHKEQKLFIMLDFTNPHRRLNPLTGEWVLVSPHRAKRPWKGTVEASQAQDLPDYDPACYLCPGNVRTNGETNPAYTDTLVFTNDHSAILADPSGDEFTQGHELIHARQERGICKVICYSPSHKKTLAELPVEHIRHVVQTWTQEYKTIGANDFISNVQIFENKGPLMGASSPHPHGQIWANEHLPTIILNEQTKQAAYFSQHNSQLLVDYAQLEQQNRERIIIQNESFVVLVPFWATWPFETMIIPKTHKSSLVDLNETEQSHLATILKDITSRYDTLFATPFPYSMGIHQAPTDKKDHPEWQMHIHFYPPLLRSATIKKYFVGYEMFAEAQRDINPETAASTLRDLHE